MKKNFVSIIVPIYNVEKYIFKCIDSIINQTYNNIEIILVDDGSKDKCPEICDEYAAKDNRICVIHKENGGLVSARKAGIEKARGEYLMFVDGDDWIADNMVELMANTIIKENVDCIICNYYKSDKEDIPQEMFFEEKLYNETDYKNIILPKILFSGRLFRFGIDPSNWCKLFRTANIKEYIWAVPDTVSLGEDAACTYPFFINSCKSVAIIDKTLYYYRQNPESILHSYSSKQIQGTTDLLKHLRKQTKSNKQFQEQLDYYTLMIIILNFINEERREFRGLYSGYCNIKEFLKNIKFKEICKNIDMRSLSGKDKIYIYSLKYGFGYLLMILKKIMKKHK